MARLGGNRRYNTFPPQCTGALHLCGFGVYISSLVRLLLYGGPVGRGRQCEHRRPRRSTGAFPLPDETGDEHVSDVQAVRNVKYHLHYMGACNLCQVTLRSSDLTKIFAPMCITLVLDVTHCLTLALSKRVDIHPRCRGVYHYDPAVFVHRALRLYSR